ncbi:MAG: hypothetical protein JWN48_5210 [Myxococcaceae bacterium]|nr:hypothetical protein [Myxococcaceae bacterium]
MTRVQLIRKATKMKPAALDPVALRTLRALYELAALDCPAHAGLLARAVNISVRDVARVLLVLDARGLAVADRARLTLLGLAEAARCAPLQLDQAAWLPKARREALQYRTAERTRAAGGGRA